MSKTDKEWGRMWNEATMVYFQVLSQKLYGENKENHKYRSLLD
jgi:hypothetical protein